MRKNNSNKLVRYSADIRYINNIALVAYLLCSFFYTIVEHKYDLWAMSPYISFFLLWAPYIAGFLLFLTNPSSKHIIHVLIFGFLFFYSVCICSVDVGSTFFMTAIPILLISVVYNNIRLTLFANLLVIAFNLYACIRALMDNTTTFIFADLFVRMGVLLLFAIFITAVIIIMIRNNEYNVRRLLRENERFYTLAASRGGRFFEYDYKSHKIKLTVEAKELFGEGIDADEFVRVILEDDKVHYEDRHIFMKLVEDIKFGTLKRRYELRVKKENCDTEYRWVRVIANTAGNMLDENMIVIGVIDDINSEMIARIDNDRAKSFDRLTKLLKPEAMEEVVTIGIADSIEGETGAFILIDIDSFSILTDIMGSAFCNEVLKNVANDILTIMDTDDIVGRIGRDIFAVFSIGAVLEDDIERRIQHILSKARTTYVGENINFGASVGIGIAMYPKDGQDYRTLYNNSVKALLHSKAKGCQKYTFYDSNYEMLYSEYINDKYSEFGTDNPYFNYIPDIDEEKHSDSLVELTFRLMEETKDTESAIKLLFCQIGNEMNIDAIVITERVSNNHELKISYQWGSLDHLFEDNHVVKYMDDEWFEMQQRFKFNSGVDVITDINDLSNRGECIENLSIKGGRGLVQCAFYERGVLKGIVSFINYDEPRDWSNEEIISMRTITNILSAYLLKMRAIEEVSSNVDYYNRYDDVTGFYRYEKFLSEVDSYFKNGFQGEYAVIYADISNFKVLNETYGYSTGDLVLKEFSNTIRRFSDNDVAICRVFSDNFVSVISTGDRSRDDVYDKVMKACKKFSDAQSIKFTECKLLVNAGISFFSVWEDSVDIKTEISNANMARKEVKYSGMPGCIIYHQEMSERLKREIDYTKNLEKAFENDEFTIFLQPKVRLKDCEIVGAEALVRWIRPDGSIIYPNLFIPVFEKNKNITSVDFFVYEKVFEYLRAMLDSDCNVVPVSMNVSRLHLHEPSEFLRIVTKLMMDYDIPAYLLEFELTENLFMDRPEEAIRFLNALKELGIMVSMDDFGSGYSSLNMLKKLPIDILKLDKEFLKDFDSITGKDVVIPSIIDMAAGMGLQVICEGVETKEQARYLESVGCGVVQGFYFSRPVTTDEFSSMLASGRKIIVD